ncbi:MAG: hypothetical protein ABIS07_13255 [Dokdonella sp.]
MNQVLRTTIATLASLVATSAFAASPVRGVGDLARSSDIPQRSATPSLAAAGLAGPSAADVGDADSFGRAVNWLGLAAESIELETDCTGVTGNCQVISPLPAYTSFSFSDIAHITLPAKSAHSLLCYWFSPLLTISYNNPTAAAVVAHLNYAPSVTVENSVLNDPSLIDPSTGVPFGGQLVTGLTSSEHLEVPLPAGLSLTERTRDSTVCIAGLVSQNALVENWGLSNAQAKEFFKHKTTLRLNIDGSAQYVDSASLYFGLRVVGD